MKTFRTFVLGAITKKDTFFRAKLKLATVIRASMGPTSTTIHLKKSVMRRLMEQLFDRSFHIEDMCRHTVDEKTRDKKSIAPIPKRDGSMGKN
jgi:hypothetical protein